MESLLSPNTFSVSGITTPLLLLHPRHSKDPLQLDTDLLQLVECLVFTRQVSSLYHHPLCPISMSPLLITSGLEFQEQLTLEVASELSVLSDTKPCQERHSYSHLDETNLRLVLLK